jgi:hypothetical protein
MRLKPNPTPTPIRALPTMTNPRSGATPKTSAPAAMETTPASIAARRPTRSDTPPKHASTSARANG